MKTNSNNKQEIPKSKTPALDLIRKGWCKKSLAKKSNGRATLVESPDAVSFCSIGAIRKAYPINRKYFAMIRRFHKVMIGSAVITSWNAISSWNDHPKRTHEEVIAAFQKAKI